MSQCAAFCFVSACTASSVAPAAAVSRASWANAWVSAICLSASARLKRFSSALSTCPASEPTRGTAVAALLLTESAVEEDTISNSDERTCSEFFRSSFVSSSSLRTSAFLASEAANASDNSSVDFCSADWPSSSRLIAASRSRSPDPPTLAPLAPLLLSRLRPPQKVPVVPPLLLRVWSPATEKPAPDTGIDAATVAPIIP